MNPTNQPASGQKLVPSTGATDAIALLTADHREVEGLFQQYDKLEQQNASAEDRQLLATQICVLLTVHTRIEEEIFYPEARSALGEKGSDLLDEAEVEHAGAKNLIRELKAMDATDDLFDAKVKVLGESDDHHVGEEEGELFPKIRNSSMDLLEVGMRMDARRKELMASTEALEPLPNELPH
jgi:hemerythrin superfamily protein